MKNRVGVNEWFPRNKVVGVLMGQSSGLVLVNFVLFCKLDSFFESEQKE